MYGVNRNVHFLPRFRETILAVMGFEPQLVILTYPDCATTTKGRTFSNDCSMLSSVIWCRTYVDKIWVGNGTPTCVKMVVGHDILAAAFNSLEFAQKADNLDGAICVCIIQSSKAVESGYLLGSRKTMDDVHWSNHFNNHQRLLNMDVQVKSHPINDHTDGPWNPRNNVNAAHILYSAKDEKAVNIQMGGMYNKKLKGSRAADDLPERCGFRYVPLEKTNTIVSTARRKTQLQKCRLMKQFALDCHHAIIVWGIVNIYQVLTTPKGTIFTLCQVVMSIKSVQNLIISIP